MFNIHHEMMRFIYRLYLTFMGLVLELHVFTVLYGVLYQFDKLLLRMRSKKNHVHILELKPSENYEKSNGTSISCYCNKNQISKPADCGS